MLDHIYTHLHTCTRRSAYVTCFGEMGYEHGLCRYVVSTKH